MPSGKIRATREHLELTGQFREDKHGNYGSSRDISYSAETIITPPASYSARTKKAWDSIVPNLLRQRVLSEQDLPTIEMMFNAFEEYDKAKAAIKAYDKEHKNDFTKESIDLRRKLNIWMLDSIKQFNNIAAHFGIMPTERLKVVQQMDEPKKADPLEIVLEG